MKKRLFLSLLCLFLVWQPICYGATYQITEQEMQTLSNNSQRLKQINDYLQLNSTDSLKTLLKVSEELKQSQAELQTLKAELAKLQENLQTAKNLSQSQQDLLTRTNESFQQYAKEQKAIQAKLKTERTIWQVVAIVAGVWGIAK